MGQNQWHVYSSTPSETPIALQADITQCNERCWLLLNHEDYKCTNR